MNAANGKVDKCPRRGCDLAAPGAIEEYTPGKFRCVICRQTDDRERRRKKRADATARVNGHDYNENTRYYVGRDGHTIRVCKICHKAGTMQSARRREQRARTGINRTLSESKVELVLDLWDQHYRASTHWERDAALAQIALLQPIPEHLRAGRGPVGPRAPRVALASG
jgi:hypothetical protein